MAALVAAVSLGLAVAMAMAWLVQRVSGNAGWVDAIWRFSTGVAGVVYAVFPVQAGGATGRQMLVAALAAAWALRLGLHIAGRSARGGEDARYAQLRRDWGAAFQRRI